MSAMFLGTAVLTMQAVNVNSKRYTSLLDVNVGGGVLSNFYGHEGAIHRCYAAPNYGQSGRVQEMRDQFRDDIARSEGVYCLARSGLNATRPELLEVLPEGGEPVIDTPEAFREFLAVSQPESASVFTPYRNVPPVSAPNLTIFLTGPESDPNYIRVIAVYEIDLVTPSNITGRYASVRRYFDNKLTNYYDVFFPDTEGKTFAPLVIAFESESRKVINEGEAIDRFKIGPRGPFYFIWWPDPTVNPSDVPPVTVLDGGSARDEYASMAGKTNYMFSVPMFPSIWGESL